MAKKALLVILDGYGLGDHKKDDAIFNTPTSWRNTRIPGSWPAEKTWGFPTDRWATAR